MAATMSASRVSVVGSEDVKSVDEEEGSKKMSW